MENLHEGFDFIFRPLPVLRGKRIERNGFEPDVVTVIHNLLKDFGTLDMAFRTGQPPLSRPAPVPVHDDPDMLRHELFRRKIGHNYTPLKRK